MQQTHLNSNQNNDDRNLDPYNALQKVIRLDKKHTNFDYYDQDKNITFRVSYPAPVFDAPNNQHLLKGFWRHINNYYFKKIQQHQLERLDYLQTLLIPNNQCEVRFSGSMEFWYTIQRLFSEQYLNRFKQSQMNNLDNKNWLQIMYLTWQKLNIKDKNKKKIQIQLNKVHSCFANLKNYHKTQDAKRKLQKLKNQQRLIEDLLPFQDDHDQISQEIYKLQNQLYEDCSNNSFLLEQLKQRVRKEIDTQDISIIHNDQEIMGAQDQDYTQLSQDNKMWKTKRKIQKMQTVQIIKKYLDYCIKNLEKKQIAQSVSKITNLNKGKSKDDSTYQIQFQTGMNINKIILSQQKLLQLNQMREYNVFKFYNTSLKTPYSFICQNYFGFRWIYQNRNKPCALKQKNIIQEMKKGKTDFPQSKAAKQFQKFDICHHCKLIYPQNYIIKCQYNSSKNGAPITPSSYYDPYISQIIKLQQPKLSNRFMGRRKNCYLGYTKTGEEYVCDRKFCKYCMRQNYQDGLDKNGLCPFCQGICFCTRCARNDMIVRLKSMYLLLGGDVNKLEQDSQMQKIIKGEAQQSQQNGRNISRSKSKPNKKPIGGTPARLNEKMRNIRYQLQDLRILCDLVKRREKQKQKLVQIRGEIFSKKVSVLGKGLDFKALNQTSLNTLIQQEQQRQQKKLKLKKKLDRMI